jgi:hypothetical protein
MKRRMQPGWFRRAGLSLCAVSVSSTVALGSDGAREEPPRGGPARSSETGSVARFAWGDFNGDSRLDLAAVGASGKLQVLASVDGGRFEDVTEQAGVAEVANAALASWGDYDDDGLLDLFVGAREGQSRLLRNEGGVFVDTSVESGLVSRGAVQSAHWLDHDGDGRLDLHVVTAERNEVFHGLEGGYFERSELPLADTVIAPPPQGSPAGGAAPSATGSTGETDGVGARGTLAPDSAVGLDGRGGRIAVGPSVGGATELIPFPLASSRTRRTPARASKLRRRRPWVSSIPFQRTSSSRSAATWASARRARRRSSMLRAPCVWATRRRSIPTA